MLKNRQSDNSQTLLVTGGLGFLGSNFVRYVIGNNEQYRIVVLDAYTYAANPNVLNDLPSDRLKIVRGDINDSALLDEIIVGVDAIVNFAAESHNDRSFETPEKFIHTNLLGTYQLAQVACRHNIRFHQVSTDEVYGDLKLNNTNTSKEEDRYVPSTPYSFSKAAANLLVFVWTNSFGLRATVSNSSNCYGPYQNSEKFIPRQIIGIINGKKPELHGNGLHVREWTYVTDHSRAVLAILEHGIVGESYNISSGCAKNNKEVIEHILLALGINQNINYLADRRINDMRYGLNCQKIRDALGWYPEHDNFEKHLRFVVEFYQKNGLPQSSCTPNPKRTPENVRSIRQGGDLTVHNTPISGLKLIDQPRNFDNRGWFKENWNEAGFEKVGITNFRPTQQNISFNNIIGTTRGIHAEPWDKIISVCSGKVFSLWVDLREGEGFGTVFEYILCPSHSVYIPKGVGNSYQSLEDGTTYSYLINGCYEPQKQYVGINLNDPKFTTKWPIPLSNAITSTKDQYLPLLNEIKPIKRMRAILLGANGQIGREIQNLFPDIEAMSREDFDVTCESSWASKDWGDYDLLINASGYTAVDAAEVEEGASQAWAVNTLAVTKMVQIAKENNITLVHISTDYIFDGTKLWHEEDEPCCPLNAYGSTKAAADAIVATLTKHYIIRTSWVIGNGRNFVNTMMQYGKSSSQVTVVNDQIGRLSFAAEVAKAVKHIISNYASYGTYNVSNEGQPLSWADIARKILQITNQTINVTGVDSSTYASLTKDRMVAKRPKNSTLNLAKLRSIGFFPSDQIFALKIYLTSQWNNDKK